MIETPSAVNQAVSRAGVAQMKAKHHGVEALRCDQKPSNRLGTPKMQFMMDGYDNGYGGGMYNRQGPMGMYGGGMYGGM